MKKIISLFSLLLICITLFGCDKRLKLNEYNFTFFDTEINIKLYNSNKEYYRNTYDILKVYNDLCDRYHEYNDLKNIYYINNHEGIIEIDIRLFELIENTLNESQKLNGKFRIGIGALSDIYNEIFDEFNKKEISSSIYNEYIKDISNININDEDIILYKDTHSIELKNGVKLDLGAVAKGYAVEKLKEYYDKENKYYTINAGESNIITNIGNPKRKNNDFLIGLRNPNDINNTYGVLNAPKNKAICTSGDYQKYFIIDSKIYSHILDPSIKSSASTDIKSITIITDSSFIADIYSTYLFIIGSNEAYNFLLENDDFEGIIYKDNGEILMTPGIKDLVTL